MPFRGFSREDLKLFRRLDTPAKIQDFLNAIPSNDEPDGDTCLSPLQVLRQSRAHCIEAAMLAAAILRFHGERPLLMDFEAADWDEDHVVAVFRRHGHWGAISKSNHAMLRYREPVYRTIRELALSYFHEYVPADGDRKSLRRYSMPVDLARLDRFKWMTSANDVWEVPRRLCLVTHRPLLNRAQIASLRRLDPIEREAGRLRDWTSDGNGVMQKKKRS